MPHLARRRVPLFAVRLMLTLALTIVAVGTVQYALVARTVKSNAYQQLLSAHTADSLVLRGLYEAEGLPAADELLGHMAARPGLLRVSLIAEDGTMLAVGTAHHAADGDMADMAATGTVSGGTGLLDGMDVRRTVGEVVDDAAATAVATLVAEARSAPDDGPVRGTATSWGADTLVRVPVRLGDEVAVLEVVGSGAGLREQVGALRHVVLLTLLVGGACALPVFYLVGGHELNARHSRALQTSVTDALTSLGNHRRFHEQLREQVQAACTSSAPLTLVLLDLDGFKQVNDTYGHRRGDSVLASVGFVLRELSPARAAYRIGGDEFALLLPGAGTSDALQVAEGVRARVEQEVDGVTTSIGVATLDAAAPDVESLVEQADGALYAAKRLGRNRVVNTAAVPVVPAPRSRKQATTHA